MTAPEHVGTFAGAGGWEQGLRLLGHTGRSLGIEIDPTVCATAEAAGHPRLQADVESLDPRDYWGVDILTNSPVCPTWSTTGNGAGVLDRPLVHERIARYACGLLQRRVTWADERSRLTAEPMRWIAGAMPRAFAIEQVPGALDLLQHTAALAGGLGYSVWVGLLFADEHGVPQSRTRAVAYGRRDGVVAHPPVVSQRRMTMREALPDDGRILISNYGTGGDAKRRGRRRMNQPSFTLTGKCCRNRWEWPDGSSRTLTAAEASILQGFPADYPWQGGSTQVQQQIGDTIPPPLAAAVLRQLVDAAARPAGLIGDVPIPLFDPTERKAS